MRDRDFLIWIHERLEHVHGENPHKDYMHKLRKIIKVVDKDQDTPNAGLDNSMEDLKKELGI